jgi:uncharacterized protein
MTSSDRSDRRRIVSWSASLPLTLLLALPVTLPFTAAAAAERNLATLVQQGERQAALALLANGADPNAAQGDGTTALHWAVYRLDHELAEALLARGANPASANNFGATPLAEATKVADAGLVERLLAAGADPDAANEDGQTALMLTAHTGSVEVADRLIAAGATLDARENWRGQTALMWAADSRHDAIVRRLIAAGADVHVRANANDWPTQITEEPRAQYRPTGGFTALHYAARSGCTACVVALLDAGADPDQPNPDGVNALMLALENFAYDTAQLLLERGADPHLWDWWGRTPLYVAADASSFGRPATRPAPDVTGAHDIIAMLLAAGVNPNPQLNMHRPTRGGNSGRFVDDLLTTGATPLLRAAIGHDVDAIRLLLDHGALVDLPNVMGVTPLLAAAGQGISGRDRRVNLGGDVQGRVIATLQVLLDAGADIDARVTDIASRNARIARPSTMSERQGQTALFGAVKFGWSRVVEFLIDQGADVTIADALGFTAEDAARGRTGGRDNTESEQIAAMLRAAAAAR